MKKILITFAAAAFLAGTAGMASATTVIHKESADGMHAKTVVHEADGSKTVIKRHFNHVKKIHKSPTGEKTVIKKTMY